MVLCEAVIHNVSTIVDNWNVSRETLNVRNAQNVSRETFQGCSVFEPCYNIEEMPVTIIYQVQRRKYAKTTFGGRINLNHKV